MNRTRVVQLSCGVIVLAVVLTFAPTALAQRGARQAARYSGGYQPGFYGYGNSGYIYSGRNLGIGFGNYPGLSSYYGYPNYNTYAPGSTYYYSTPNYYSSPGYGYYSAPNYYYPGAVAGSGDPRYQYPMAGATTESLYQQPAQQPAGTALITVRLPADAMLWTDGIPTSQTGAVRQFVTPVRLDPGKNYQYTLKAQWTENGQPITRERVVNFQAGGQVTVDFTQPSEQ